MNLKLHSIIALTLVLLVGCQSQDQYNQTKPDPFDIKEPGQTIEPIVVENNASSGDTPPPLNSTSETVFEPGEISWVNPDYSIVFHPLKEGFATTKKPKFDNVLTSDLSKSSPLYVDNTIYNRIELRRFSKAYPSGSQIVQARELGYVFTGFYWPEALQQGQQKVLHMFACPFESQEESLFYEIDDLIIECNSSKSHFFVHVPARSPYNAWFDCESARYTESYAPGKGVGCSSTEEKQPSFYSYELFYWFDKTLTGEASSQSLHSRAFERRGVYRFNHKNPNVPPSNTIQARTIEVGL